MASKALKPIDLLNNFIADLDKTFSGDVQYTDIIDWYDNGGICKKTFGIELTIEQRVILKCYDGVVLNEDEKQVLRKWKEED